MSGPGTPTRSAPRSSRVPTLDALSNQEARWLAIEAQGLAAPRRPEGGPRQGEAALRRVMRQVGTIQLDAVNVLERTQFLVPFSRLGSYDRAALGRMSGPQRPWFEYWGHAASLLPVEMYPLLGPRRAGKGNDLIDRPASSERRRSWRADNARYMRTVLQEVAERGPLAASQLSDPQRRTGEWWDRRSIGRLALEMLFTDGVLAAWRNPNFERVYDLAERVIPAPALAQPVPGTDEAQRELLVIAARCLGVATVSDLADYFWLRPPVARLRVGELVEEARLRPVKVEGWRQPAFVLADPRPRARRRQQATLLSPFDSLIWCRERTERLFGVRYRIEIYVPEPLRTHGYYVLPLLAGDRLAARFDLKADRKAGRLRIAAAHLEPGADAASTLDAAVPELGALGRWLGLDGTSIEARGDLAPALRRALSKRARAASTSARV